jgi:2-polyprenyl-3-methyl-5-hydroxy-6-metoxy-1,4-benzoquinol methylase
MRTYSDQLASEGISTEPIVHAALESARPAPGLRWLDVGCGRGDLLRVLRDAWQPAALAGVDPIDWLADDLRTDVDFRALPGEEIRQLPAADRVLLVEVIEHLEAPWSTLREAARLVAPGGWIVVSTPNLATLRCRIELAVRGRLTPFRPENLPHISPALPHVTRRVLEEEGLRCEPERWAGVDVIPLTGGRVWPEAARRRWPELSSVSVIVAAQREPGEHPAR